MPSLNFSTTFGGNSKMPTYFIEQMANADLQWQEKATTYLKDLLLVAPEIEGKKIHTIRSGNRWKSGSKCHIFTGLRTKNTKKYGVISCVSTQKITINFWNSCSPPTQNKDVAPQLIQTRVLVDGRKLSKYEIEVLAHNDGLDIGDFKQWFWKATNKGSETFEGQIIHWTSLTY